MAEIHDQLVLDIDQALRDVQRLEASLDRALAPIEIEVDTQQTDELLSTLREVERIADRAATEIGSIDLAAGRAEVNFEDMARAMGITEAEARDLTTELLQAQAASNRLEDASRDVARQLGLSDKEAERLAGSLREADRAADAIDVTTIGLAGRFASLRASAGLFAGALAAVGGAAIFGTALVGANAAIQSFARLEDSINAVNVLFDDAAAGVIEFGETAARSAGLSQEAFNQAVAPIGAVLRNFGFDATEAADAAVILVQRGADLASVYGGSVQDALLSINSALVGQVEPLRRYGGEISQARVEAFALANGLLAAGQEMDTATTIQARFGLILQDTSVVAGDFANTADDLANAQRTAAGTAANFGAEIGEVLAPAMEDLLVLLPDVLEGVRQLVPEFAAGAESAAAFFTALGEGGGFRTEFAAVRAGIDAATSGAGFFADAIGAAASAFSGDFDNAKRRLDALAGAFASPIVRGIGVNLANQLDKGTDAVDAFGDAITQTARLTTNFDVFTTAFRDFAIAGNLTQEELQGVTLDLITNATQFGLTAAEVDFLRLQLILLNDALNGNDVGAERAANRARDVGEAFSTTTTTFTTFSGQVEDAETRASNALTDLAANAEASANRTQAAFDLFAEAPEAITTSFADAVEDLAQQVEDVATFEANLARLGALGLDALVAEFKEQGPAAATQVVEALNDLDLARQADQLLRGIPGPAVQGLVDGLAAELVAGGIDQQSADLLLETFDSPIVRDAVELAAKSVGASGVDAYAQGVEDRVTDLGEIFDPSRFVDFTTSTERFFQGGQDAGEAYQSGLRNSLEISSPSKVMMRIAEDAAAGFLQGWDQADLTLRTPVPPVTGAVSGFSQGTSAGVDIDVTINNPAVNDMVSDTARVAQYASSIAASYRAVT